MAVKMGPGMSCKVLMLTAFPGLAIKGSKGTRQEEGSYYKNSQAMTSGVIKAASDHPALGVVNMFHNIKITVHLSATSH